MADQEILEDVFNIPEGQAAFTWPKGPLSKDSADLLDKWLCIMAEKIQKSVTKPPKEPDNA